MRLKPISAAPELAKLQPCSKIRSLAKRLPASRGLSCHTPSLFHERFQGLQVAIVLARHNKPGKRSEDNSRLFFHAHGHTAAAIFRRHTVAAVTAIQPAADVIPADDAILLPLGQRPVYFTNTLKNVYRR